MNMTTNAYSVWCQDVQCVRHNRYVSNARKTRNFSRFPFTINVNAKMAQDNQITKHNVLIAMLQY